MNASTLGRRDAHQQLGATLINYGNNYCGNGQAGYAYTIKSLSLNETGMPDLHARIKDMRTRTAELSIQLSKQYSASDQQGPIGALGMLHNLLILVEEQLGFYISAWTKAGPQSANMAHETVLLLRDENAQRVVAVVRSAFISALSSIEFVAKQTFTQYAQLFPQKTSGRIYLAWIIDESAKIDLIPAADLDPWKGMIELRNTIVHNNAIADKTVHFDVPGTPGINLVDGTMCSEDLKFFPGLILWMIDAYARWCEGALRTINR